tara:strand:+ start:1638 stop:1832 length:195 start_codon:yes stop_codon:yes gene_type:complete
MNEMWVTFAVVLVVLVIAIITSNNVQDIQEYCKDNPDATLQVYDDREYNMTCQHILNKSIYWTG